MERLRAGGWDRRLGSHICDGLAQVVVVIGPVGQHGLGPEDFEQGFCSEVVVSLAGGEYEAQRPAQAIAEHVDLGRQPASRTPQHLSFGPPFCSRPVGGHEPGWCIRYLLSRSLTS